MNTNSTDFACLVTGFLTDYLPLQRCYSNNTILSYRDTLKLFLRFLSDYKAGRRVWGFMGVEVVAKPDINGFYGDSQSTYLPDGWDE